MTKLTCAVCNSEIPFYGNRYKILNKGTQKRYICGKCVKKSDKNAFQLKKMRISEIKEAININLNKSMLKTKDKAESKAIKQGFKEITAGKPFIAVLIKQDSSNTFKSSDVSLSNDYVYQHEAGKVIINDQKEYLLKSAAFTPLITGSKEFSVGKALTGAALIGELGLIAGASGKKGEDKSYCTLLLQEVESDEIVKITADCSVGQAKTLANFITAEEAVL